MPFGRVKVDGGCIWVGWVWVKSDRLDMGESNLSQVIPMNSNQPFLKILFLNYPLLSSLAYLLHKININKEFYNC